MTAYQELLKHPFWQRKRLEILQRDEWTCTKCGETMENLQIHHLGYLRDTMPWEYPSTMLTTYCELCHEKAEFVKWVVRNATDAMKKDGFITGDIREVIELVTRRVTLNHHAQSARDYMRDIKQLLSHD